MDGVAIMQDVPIGMHSDRYRNNRCSGFAVRMVVEIHSAVGE